MLDFFKFIFSNFWHFVGFMLILSAILKVAYVVIHIIVRHSTIRKVGYPPSHCDADGDFRKIDNDEEVDGNE